jgi:potassium channel LctB
MYEVIAMEYVLLGFVVIVLFVSIASVWITQSKNNQYISLENFFVLILLYFTMMVGFGLIYTTLQMNGYRVFIKNIDGTTGEFFNILQDSLYLSATTLLSVGYGDIIPVGMGRWIAVMEALLGYIIPATFVARVMIDWKKE